MIIKDLVPIERIENTIYLIRGQKVLIDRDLAMLYDVETKYLNRQVKRNIERFPEDFMFQLTVEEKNELVTNWHRFKTMKHSSVLPYAFTEHGILMLSSVLKSDRAVQVNIIIMRTFIKLRRILSTHKELDIKIKELETKSEKHDKEIHAILEAIRKLMEPPMQNSKKRIGFKV